MIFLIPAEMSLSGNFDSDVELLDRILRVDESFDMLKRELIYAKKRAVMYYIDGFVKAEMMQKLMMHLTTLEYLGDGSDNAAEFAAKGGNV